MKQNIILSSLIGLFLFSCTSTNQEKLEYLNGYWEIEEATLNGQTKIYKYNATVDFFMLDSTNTGFRKKVKPQIGGTFITSNQQEKIKVVFENDSMNIYYKTPFFENKETVTKITKDKLIIVNQDLATYKYKRYEPIIID